MQPLRAVDCGPPGAVLSRGVPPLAGGTVGVGGARRRPGRAAGGLAGGLAGGDPGLLGLGHEEPVRPGFPQDAAALHRLLEAGQERLLALPVAQSDVHRRSPPADTRRADPNRPAHDAVPPRGRVSWDYTPRGARPSALTPAHADDRTPRVPRVLRSSHTTIAVRIRRAERPSTRFVVTLPRGTAVPDATGRDRG